MYLRRIQISRNPKLPQLRKPLAETQRHGSIGATVRCFCNDTIRKAPSWWCQWSGPYGLLQDPQHDEPMTSCAVWRNAAVYLVQSNQSEESKLKRWFSQPLASGTWFSAPRCKLLAMIFFKALASEWCTQTGRGKRYPVNRPEWRARGFMHLFCLTWPPPWNLQQRINRNKSFSCGFPRFSIFSQE